MVRIIRANREHIAEITPLFDSYRIFYGRSSNKAAAEKFLLERISNDESIIFLADYESEAVGFTQLYKTFSSVSLQPFFVLNDLFVKPEYRGKGIGEALLEKTKTYCSELGYKGLALETATDNPAQKLYEKLDWEKDTDYFHYFWTASKK